MVFGLGRPRHGIICRRLLLRAAGFFRNSIWMLFYRRCGFPVILLLLRAIIASSNLGRRFLAGIIIFRVLRLNGIDLIIIAVVLTLDDFGPIEICLCSC
jgi:hypothetical protein